MAIKESKNDKVIQLKGGIGNQLFQLAYAFHLKAHGFNVLFDDAWYKLKPAKDTFRINYVSSKQAVFSTRTNYKNFLLNRLFGVVSKKSEERFYDRDYMSSKSYFNGYYQNYTEARKYISCVRDAIGLDRHISLPKNSIALHVRRGDFLKLGIPCPTASDYMRALKMLPGFDHYYLFSDDLDLAMQDLSGLNLNFKFFTGLSEWEEFTLLSSAQYKVISNSTFSVWADWLSLTKVKTVRIDPNNIVPQLDFF